MAIDKPAILGGNPEFASLFPIIKPNFDRYTEALIPKIKEILQSNMLSGVNIHVAELEEKLSTMLKVDHVVAVSTCTSGMILALQAAGFYSKEILVPSFSFSATAHMAYWNNCSVKFVDCDLNTFNIDLADIKRRITNQTRAIIAVHMYGNPCEINELVEFCQDKDLMLFFDAAHALGSKYKDTPVASQGDVHAFSCSPTKLFCTIEGGFVATNNEKIAEKVSLGRNYGNFPDYSCESPGMSARMSEIHAAAGLVTIKDIPTFVSNRNRYVNLYQEKLKLIPGIKFQKITEGCVSTYKDFSILIDPEKFGMDRNLLAASLNAENIHTKFYFYPPIHELDAYVAKDKPVLPITTQISYNVLSLPIHNFMKEEDIIRITSCINTIHEHSAKIKKNKKN